MQISTSFFGELNVEEENIITFEQGLPGFEHLTKYTLIQLEDSAPFSYFQSLEEGELSFLVTNPFLFFEDYDFSLSDGVQEELAIVQPEYISVWCVVTVSHDFSQVTANLLAPIIVNSKNQLGKQIILHDTDYKVKHELVIQRDGETNEARGEENAGSGS